MIAAIEFGKDVASFGGKRREHWQDVASFGGKRNDELGKTSLHLAAREMMNLVVAPRKYAT